MALRALYGWEQTAAFDLSYYNLSREREQFFRSPFPSYANISHTHTGAPPGTRASPVGLLARAGTGSPVCGGAAALPRRSQVAVGSLL